MTGEGNSPDLRLLCSQVFTGIGYMHGEDIIASRRKLLFQEAVKMLHSAGIEGEEFKKEMEGLEQLIKLHLDSNGTTATQESADTTAESEETQTSECLPDRDWVNRRFEDGSHYLGQALAGEPDGHGTTTWPTGAAYSGAYVRGKSHGAGKYKRLDGGEYIGAFEQGDFHGKGVFRWPDGRKYSGTWARGRFHGEGTYLGKGGTKTEGHFAHGKRNGYSRETFPDGSFYAGEWKNNSRHGRGTLKKPDGTVLAGEFVNGRLVDPKAAKKTVFQKAKSALVFATLAFLGLSLIQARPADRSFFDILEMRWEQVADLTAKVGFARDPKPTLGTGNGAVMRGIDDMVFYEEDVLLLRQAQFGLAEAEFGFAKVLYRSNSQEAMENAYHYLKRAAAQGHTGALEELGMMYFTGALERRDLARSYVALSLAEMDGEPVSKASFDRILSEMSAEEMASAQEILRACILEGVSTCAF
jgi:hypothetical protein